MASESVERLTESVWTRLIARMAMIATPLIVTMFGWFTFNYLDIRFTEQSHSLDAVVTRVDRIESAATAAVVTVAGIDKRTSIVENNQSISQRTQDAISAKLDTIVNSISELREKTASISATVEVIKLRKDLP